MRVSEQIVNELRSYDKEKEWFDNLKEELFDASKAEAKVSNIIDIKK